jgi:hypothetical protein
MYKCTAWCELSLPDDADIDEVINTAKKYKDDANASELIVSELGFNMEWSIDHETEEPMSLKDNDGFSTLEVYNGSELVYENDDTED